MDKVDALLFQLLELFLAHRAPHHIRLAKRVSRQRLENLHDLLLIDHTAVGDGQDGFQKRVLVGHLFRIVAAFGVARDILHRAGAVQRDHRRNILNRLRAQVHHHVRHAARFQLEHAHGAALPKHLVGRLVIKRYVVHPEIRTPPMNHFFRVRDDSQVAQAEEVHFQQPKLLQRHHGILCDRLAVIHRKRDVGINRVLRNDNARRVGGGVARHAFQSARGVYQVFHLGVAVVHFFQLGIGFQRLVNGDMQFHWHLLGNHIDLVVRDVQGAAYIADGAARSHRAEGDNLRHMVRAVFFGDVLDDLGAAHITEINIDIGHGDALRVKEALEIK